MQGTDESTKVYFYFTFEIKDCIGNLSISGNLSPTVVSGVGDTIQYTVSPNVSYSIQDTITPDPNTETNTYIIVSHSHSVEDKLQIRVYGTTPINTYSIVITINSRGYYPATATISLSVVAS
jgi:hypothetical protein